MFIEYSLIKEFILELVYKAFKSPKTYLYHLSFVSSPIWFLNIKFPTIYYVYVTAGGKPTVIAGVDMKSERDISENK